MRQANVKIELVLLVRVKAGTVSVCKSVRLPFRVSWCPVHSRLLPHRLHMYR